MGKGSKPKAPAKPKPTETEIAQARISAEKWNDFVTRHLPNEGLLRHRTQSLNLAPAYNAAMAKVTNNAAEQMGDASRAAVKQMAGGGTPLALLEAYTGANDMSANGMVQQYGNQRFNYLNQGTNLLKMGAGISGAGMNSFKSVADYDRSEANRAYADSVGRNLADASQRLGTLNALGNLALSGGRDAGVYSSLSNGFNNVSTAFKNNTTPFSQQTNMLAAQERGF